MIYGPGEYVFKDFLRFGLPMQLWQMVATIGFIVLDESYWLSYLISIGSFAAFVAFASLRRGRFADHSRARRETAADVEMGTLDLAHEA